MFITVVFVFFSVSLVLKNIEIIIVYAMKNYCTKETETFAKKLRFLKFFKVFQNVM